VLLFPKAGGAQREKAQIEKEVKKKKKKKKKKKEFWNREALNDKKCLKI
jgi:hypothetical protein